MSQTLSCELPYCNFTCTKQSEMRKHGIEHSDPEKLRRCPHCKFVTLHQRNLLDHINTHDNSRPHKCTEIVDGARCKFRSNCLSALSRHRKLKHQYTRQDSETQAGPSSQHTLPASPSEGSDYELAANSAEESSVRSSHASTSMSTPSPMDVDSTDDAIVASNIASSMPLTFPYTPTSNTASTSLGLVVPHNNSGYNSYSAFPTSRGQVPFHNAPSNYTHPVRGEGFNNRANTLAQPAVVNSGLLSQYNFADRNVSASLGQLPHNHATALSRTKTLAQTAILNSAFSSQYNFNFVDRNASATASTSINSTQVPPVSLYSSLAGALGDESPPSASVTSSYTTNSSPSPESYVEYSPSPSTEAVTPHDDEPLDSIYAGSSAAEPIDVDAWADSCASHDGSLPEPPLNGVLSVPQEALDFYDDSEGDLTKYMPSLLLLTVEFDADEIFYRGTGREGCLCPEMMVDAGIEGWDKSVLENLVSCRA